MTASTGPLDGCPQCLIRNNPPIHITDDGRSGITALYRCRACLYSWTTAWAPGWSAAQ